MLYDSTTPSNVSPSSQDDTAESWTSYHDEHEPPQHIPETEDVVDANGRLICQQPAYDRLLNAEVQLQLGEKVQSARVLQRSVGPDGTIERSYDNNPLLNSMIYDLDFPDGTIREYSANIIAENMLTQVD